MRKRFRKALAVLLILSLLISFVLSTSITVESATIAQGSVGTTYKTQSEAVNWATGQVGYTIGDGWCSAFASSYIEYLTGSPMQLNGKDYAYNYPSGWTAIQYYNGFSPQPGDLVVYDYSAWAWVQDDYGNTYQAGHVGIIVYGDSSSFTSVEQNVAGRYVSYCYGRTYNNSDLHVWGVIRPDYVLPIPDFKASVSRGQDSVYMTSEDVTMSVNASNYDSCWLTIVHTPIGGSPYTFWEGSVSNSYTRKFPEQGYYSCYFRVTVYGNTYSSGWVGWNVFPSFNATIDRGNDGQYLLGENVIISLDNLDFDSCYLQIYHTPSGGSTTKCWSGDVPKEPVTMNFNKEGHYSCHYMITRNGKTFSSGWVGWDLNAPVYHAVANKGEEAQYGYGEDVVISIDNHDFDTAMLHMVYTPIGGTTSNYLVCEATKEPLTFQFDKEGHYSCYYSVERNGMSFDSKWVGWDIVPAYHANTNKGWEGNFEVGEDVTISIDYHDFDTACLHIYHTPTGGSTYHYLDEAVSKEPVTHQFDKEGHYSCYYSVERNGKTIISTWVGWNVGIQTTNNIIGDTNLDGHISISDVTAIQRHLVELAVFTDEQLALADTNGDGRIDISDATHLQMYLAEYDIVLGKQ